jgi:hypothetical protein
LALQERTLLNLRNGRALRLWASQPSNGLLLLKCLSTGLLEWLEAADGLLAGAHIGRQQLLDLVELPPLLFDAHLGGTLLCACGLASGARLHGAAKELRTCRNQAGDWIRHRCLLC